MAKAVHILVWEYEVVPGAEAEFEALYGPQGDWVVLFRSYPGYLGTELMRGEHPRRYITLDRWRSAADYAHFRLSAQDAQAALDARGDVMLISVERLGAFDSID
jgi:heme-degrading monooxygenase HmoA